MFNFVIEKADKEVDCGGPRPGPLGEVVKEAKERGQEFVKDEYSSATALIYAEDSSQATDPLVWSGVCQTYYADISGKVNETGREWVHEKFEPGWAEDSFVKSYKA